MSAPNMAGFATKKALGQIARHNSQSFFLGSIHPDHGTNFKAGVDDDRGIFVGAGTRSGKGTTLIIPNLLSWTGGIFCIDPKGENASITAIRRGTAEGAQGTGTSVRNFMGQNVAVLDPYGTVKGPARAYCTKYNPLIDINITLPEATDNIMTAVEAIVVQEQGTGAHFSESAETVLAGIIEAVLVLEPAERRTLAYCRKLLQEGFKELDAYLDKCKTPSGLASEARAIMLDAGSEEYGSIRTTLSRQMRFMADTRMQEQLEHSEFSLSKAVQENWSVYVCVPPSKIGRASRWLRLIARIAIDAKMNSTFEHEGQQSLFVLDEFAALGTLKILEEASAYVAGYGIKLMPIIQNIGQVKKLYPKNWETFLGNAGTIIAWGLNDLETEQYLSDRMGKVMEWEDSYSQTQSLQGSKHDEASQSMAKSTTKKERAVRWPNEIHHQGVRETMRGFVISAASMPFTIQRKNYFDIFDATYYEAPTAIAKWEQQHGE